MIRDKLDPREDPEVRKAQDNFVNYLNANQSVLNMPDSVAEDFVRLAGTLAKNAMIFGYNAAIDDINEEIDTTFPEGFPCNGLPS